MFAPHEIPFVSLVTHGSDVHRWATAVNVKLLLPPRQSRGNSLVISNVFAYHLRVQGAVTANAAMPLVAGEDVRTPLGAFRVVFGIGHFDNQINFEAPTIRPTLAKRRCGHRPESPKSAHIARSSFGYGETQRFKPRNAPPRVPVQAAPYRVTYTHRWGWHHAEHSYF
jgi:hypothetical protein